MDREEAAELLAKTFYEQGIREGVSYFYEQLESPFTPSWKQFHEHYKAADTDQQQLYDFAVKEAIKGAIVGLCIFFDGAAGYKRVDDKPAILTVSLNIYSNSEAIGVDSPESSIPICPCEEGEDVHDILLAVLDEENSST